MTLTDQLSRLADNLAISAIVVGALALLAHAAEFALSRHARRVAAPRLVGAGAPLEESPDAAAVVSDRMGLVGRIGTSLVCLATGLTIGAVLVRGYAAGRAPWGNMYEFGLTGSAAVGVVYLLFLRRHPVRGLGMWVVALMLSLLGASVTVLHTPVDDLVPVLDSAWLITHVAAAILAGALFTVGAVAVGVQLVSSRGGRSSATADTYGRVAHTAHLIAFPIWTFAVIAGAIWAENAWGRYWGWDPKETWAFITWIFYAAHLHAVSTAGWRRAAGLLALAGFAAFVFNFFGVNIWIPGLHSYAGV